MSIAAKVRREDEVKVEVEILGYWDIGILRYWEIGLLWAK